MITTSVRINHTFLITDQESLGICQENPIYHVYSISHSSLNSSDAKPKQNHPQNHQTKPFPAPNTKASPSHPKTLPEFTALYN